MPQVQRVRDVSDVRTGRSVSTRAGPTGRRAPAARTAAVPSTGSRARQPGNSVDASYLTAATAIAASPPTVKTWRAPSVSCRRTGQRQQGSGGQLPHASRRRSMPASVAEAGVSTIDHASDASQANATSAVTARTCRCCTKRQTSSNRTGRGQDPTSASGVEVADPDPAGRRRLVQEHRRDQEP